MESGSMDTTRSVMVLAVLELLCNSTPPIGVIVRLNGTTKMVGVVWWAGESGDVEPEM